MKIPKILELEFEVDKLTHSIENARSGDSFPTEILLLFVQKLES